MSSGMSNQLRVYLWRDSRFARNQDTVVSAAPRDAVVSIYGGGGFMGSDGVNAAFGGGAVFRNDDTGACYLGVWGARNASRFRRALRDRGGATLAIVREPP